MTKIDQNCEKSVEIIEKIAKFFVINIQKNFQLQLTANDCKKLIKSR